TLGMIIITILIMDIMADFILATTGITIHNIMVITEEEDITTKEMDASIIMMVEDIHLRQVEEEMLTATQTTTDKVVVLLQGHTLLHQTKIEIILIQGLSVEKEAVLIIVMIILQEVIITTIAITIVAIIVLARIILEVVAEVVTEVVEVELLEEATKTLTIRII
ncbi:MAG: hypothetical protein Q4C98_05900, partial [Capnocytophaga sp.]|nr:hypothetical protein [Capnocytophaga sp.]